MNTKLRNLKINPEFQDLFSFESQKDKIQHNADMISFRILSEVEKVCDEKKIKKKELAEMINSSRSYITQLFRGSKHVNTVLLGKLEEALDISFEIKVKLNQDSTEEYISKQIPFEFFDSNKRIPYDTCVMYCFPGNKMKDNTKEFISSIHTENKLKQKAG